VLLPPDVQAGFLPPLGHTKPPGLKGEAGRQGEGGRTPVTSLVLVDDQVSARLARGGGTAEAQLRRRDPHGRRCARVLRGLSPRFSPRGHPIRGSVYGSASSVVWPETGLGMP